MAYTTPATAVAGTVLTASFWNQQVRDNWDAAFPTGVTIQTYTPTLSQGASSNIAKTVNVADYMRIGPFVFLSVYLTATASGSAGSAVTITLPVNAHANDVGTVHGSGYYNDVGAAAYPCVCDVASATTLRLLRADVVQTGDVGVNPNIAVANTDIFQANTFYRAA